VSDPAPGKPIGALLAIGVATGILAGLLGVGGGIIMVPALVAIGYTRHQSNAISLATIFLVAISGVIGFATSEAVHLPAGLAMGVGGLFGATIGSRWASVLSGTTLARIFGVLLVVTGIRMLVAGGASPGEALVAGTVGLALSVLVGAVAGIVSGLAGIGGGVIMVPAMVLLLSLSQHTAEGTSLLAIVFTSAAGTRINSSNRFVDWRAVWLLSIGGVIFAPVAAIMAQRIPSDTLARIFAIWVLGTAVRTLWKARRG
jgi:hypothetical protein